MWFAGTRRSAGRRHAPRATRHATSAHIPAMSLFEWWMERGKEAPDGELRVGSPEREGRSPEAIALRGAIAVVVLAALLSYVVTNVEDRRDLLFYLGLLAFYLGAAFWLSPEPDADNMGMAGGIIDHPFRYSDDVNRRLLLLRVLLAPGRFVTVSLRDAIAHGRGRRTMVFRRRDDDSPE